MRKRGRAAKLVDFTYRVDCQECGPNHFTGTSDRAWEERDAHERATGHRTFVHVYRSQRRPAKTWEPDRSYAAGYAYASGYQD